MTGRALIGVAAFAAMAWAGCETERYVSDAQHPEVCITAAGGVTFRGRFVEPEDLPGLLRDASFRKTDTIYISAPDDMSDWRLKRRVMGILSRGGFTRPVLVGEQKSYSEAGRTADERRRERQAARHPPDLRGGGRRLIRYK